MAGTRVRKTTEEKLSEVETQIAIAQQEIEKQNARLTETKKQVAEKIKSQKARIKSLEQKRNAILNPKPVARRVGMKTVMDKVKEMGMSPKEMAEKLGIEL